MYASGYIIVLVPVADGSCKNGIFVTYKMPYIVIGLPRMLFAILSKNKGNFPYLPGMHLL